MVEQDNSTNHSIVQGFSFQLDRRMQSVRKGTEKESDSGTESAMQTRSIDAGRLETGDKE